MTRLGQSDIHIHNSRVGEVWVRYISHDASLFPRLKFGLSSQTLDLRDGSPAIPAVPRRYSLSNWKGQLRLISDTGPAVGILHVVGRDEYHTSADYVRDRQFDMVCELDSLRLDSLVSASGRGKAPQFIVELSCTVVEAPTAIVQISPIRVDLGIEKWLQYLNNVGYGQWDLLAIRVPVGFEDHTKNAINHLRAARAFLVRGKTNEAVSECRLVLESLPGDVDLAKKVDELKGFLGERTDERRGDYYYGIISRLMQLSAMKHHAYGAGTNFSYPEAEFIVRCVEALVALTGDLAEGSAIAPKPS